MIGAQERARVARFSPAHRIAAVPAAVEEDLQLAGAVARGDHAFLADIGDEEVARIGDLAFVAHEVPRPGENPLELQLVDLGIGEDLALHRSIGDVHHRLEAGSRFDCHPGTPPISYLTNNACYSNSYHAAYTHAIPFWRAQRSSWDQTELATTPFPAPRSRRPAPESPSPRVGSTPLFSRHLIAESVRARRFTWGNWPHDKALFGHLRTARAAGGS